MAYYKAYKSRSKLTHLASLVILGWSLMGLTSIGHEIYHLKKRSKLHDLLGFFYLDLWSVPKNNWIERHNKWHHYNVHEPGEDEHLVEGSIIKNIINTALVLIKTYQLTEFSAKNILLISLRILIFNKLSPVALPIIYLTTTFCVSYFTFISHSAPVIIENESNSLKQVHRSVDIFPNNQLMIFLFGAFNMHTAHHLIPDKTRDDLYEVHQKMMLLYSKDYRVIETFSELVKLHKFRHVKFNNMIEWNEAIKDK
jgi:fatty acid desaturase